MNSVTYASIIAVLFSTVAFAQNDPIPAERTISGDIAVNPTWDESSVRNINRDVYSVMAILDLASWFFMLATIATLSLDSKSLTCSCLVPGIILWIVPPIIKSYMWASSESVEPAVLNTNS